MNDFLQRALNTIQDPAQKIGGAMRELPTGVKAFFDLVKPLVGLPTSGAVDSMRKLGSVGKSTEYSWTRPQVSQQSEMPPQNVQQNVPPQAAPAPTLPELLPSQQALVDYATKMDQLQNMANYVGRTESPVAREFPGLLQVEQEANLPGLARVLATLSQIESNMGENAGYDPSTNNPFGLLSAGHGTAPMVFPSITDAARYTVGLFTDPNFVYGIEPGTPLSLDVVQNSIAPHYNIEGGPYWDLFNNLYSQGL